jgi:hypothetical protein
VTTGVGMAGTSMPAAAGDQFDSAVTVHGLW